MEKLKINPAAVHGEILPMFDNVWHVMGQVKMPMLFPKMKISKGMTIIRNPNNGELTIVNAMRLSESGLQKLETLGSVKNLLRIGGFHGRDDAFFRERYAAKIYALKGHVYTREMMKTFPAPEDGYMQADVWLDEHDELPVPNAALKWFSSCTKPEALLRLDQDGGILVSADSLQNTGEPDEFNNWFSRIMMKKMGFFKPYNVGPGWIQFASPSKEDVRSILDLDFEHVLPGHGNPVIGGAKEKYRPVLDGELVGCHV